MKKRMILFLMVALLLSCLVLPVTGEQAQTNYVMDEAGLLTASEQKYLENRAAEISENSRIGVYIVILSDYRDDSNTTNFESFAMDFYDDHNLGWGEDNAGIMLLLSMAERDYDLDVNSIRARGIFTESALDSLEDAFLPDFRWDDFYSGFSDYLTKCEKIMLRKNQELSIGIIGGADGPTHIMLHSRVDSSTLLVAAIVGAVVALLVGLLLCSPMKSAKQKRDADQYVTRAGLNLRRHSDMFLHRTVTRRPRQTESTSHGSSGGSHHYSSGSHSGRSGKF